MAVDLIEFPLVQALPTLANESDPVYEKYGRIKMGKSQPVALRAGCARRASGKGSGHSVTNDQHVIKPNHAFNLRLALTCIAH